MTRTRLPQTPGAHHERLAFAATKIIEQTGFAHLRSRLTFDGSDRNSAACVAMNASRGFPPYSRCHWISVRSPASVSSKRVLAGADCMKKLRSAFAGELVCRGLAEAGVDVRIGVTVTGIDRPGGTGPVTLTLEGGGEVEADEVLFATGRLPLTDDIGLDTVGLVPGAWLEIDDTCMVTALKGDGEVGGGWLYALGDVNRHALLTHQGKYQARIAGAAIVARAAGQPIDPAPWGPHAVTADFRAVPQVFFCDPPAGAVGLTADQAERAGYRTRVIDVDPGQAVPGAGLYADGYTGRARMVVDEDRGCLLGVTFVGPSVEELLHSATIAVAGQVPVSRLWHAVPCFPSISEVWLRLLEAYQG